MLQRQIDDLEMAIQSARYEQDGGRDTVKQIEKTRKTLQAGDIVIWVILSIWFEKAGNKKEFLNGKEWVKRI